MIDLKIHNLKEVKSGFNKMILKLENPKSEMEIIAGKAWKDVISHFKDESGPGGRWVGHAQRTAERRRPGMKPGRAMQKGIKSAVKILQDTGRLRNAIRWRVLKNEAHVFIQLVYAAVHNFGYDKKNIPQREYLWLSQKTIREIYESIKRFIRLSK